MSHRSSDGCLLSGPPRRSCGCQSCRARFGQPIAEMEGLAGADGVEVSPCRTTGTREGREEVEVCARSEAQFWSVYAHQEEGGVFCLGDFDNEPAAMRFARAVIREGRKLHPMPLGIVSGAMPEED